MPTAEELVALGRSGRWAELELAFAQGWALPALDAQSRAGYLMSFLGRRGSPLRFIDGVIGRALDRWWIGHRVYNSATEGITTTAPGVRWLWRVMFPGYTWIRTDRGDEVFDFRIRSVPSTTDATHEVSGVEWYLAHDKLPRRIAQPFGRFARWFAWEFTRTELAYVGDGVVLGRITWRCPGVSRWLVTSYYIHRWVFAGVSQSHPR